MEKIQRERLLWRIPLVAAILVAMFWGIWSFFGPVPGIRMLGSRWWDILFASIWAFVFVLIFSSEAFKRDKGPSSFLISCLAASLILGLVIGLFLSLGLGLIVGLIIFLALALIINLVTLLKFIFSGKTLTGIGHWLSGKS